MKKFKKILLAFIFIFLIGLSTNSLAQQKHSEKKTKESETDIKKRERIKLSKDTEKLLNKALFENDKLHKLYFKMGTKGFEEQINNLINAVKTAGDNNDIKAEHKDQLSDLLNKSLNFLVELKKSDNPKSVYAKVNQQFAQIVRVYSVDSNYHIFYCPMEKKPWVAKGVEVNNPYAPKEMPHCGELKF